MADAPADPYAAGRANLRETAKWLAAVLSGLGAVVAAGISASGFAALSGEPLTRAVVAAGLAMACILVGIALLVRILGVEAYFLGTLRQTQWLVKRIDEAGTDLLPPGIASFQQLVTNRDAAYATLASLAHLPASDPKRKAAEESYASYRAETQRILGFASFLRLRWIFNGTLLALLLLFVVAAGSLSWLGYQLAKAKPDEAAAKVATLSPGEGWGAVGAALAKACGAGPLAGVAAGEPPFAGWWTVTLSGPGPCAGAKVTVPEGLVVIAAEPPR
jgi:hypothetical protein